MSNDYYNYGQPSYGYPSYGQPACGPCQPKFEEMGYVAYTPLPGSRGLEDQLDGAVGFWNSLADPSLGECVNAFGGTGRLAIANSPQFGCGFGNYGGGNYQHGGYGNYGQPHGGGHGGGAQHASYGGYSSPYVQPFANQQACAPNNYYSGPKQYANAPANYGPKTPEEMERALNDQYRMLEIYENYQDKLQKRAERKAEAEGHTNTYGSIGGHGGGHGNDKHLSDADVLAEAMKTSEGFKGFLRKRLQDESTWISEGDVDADGLAQLATEYFSQNPEELHGRHLSVTEVESACFQYIEHNKDNHSNMSPGKVAVGAGIGATALAWLFSGPAGWSTGGALAGGLLGAGSSLAFSDDFELNKGDMANIH